MQVWACVVVMVSLVVGLVFLSHLLSLVVAFLLVVSLSFLLVVRLRGEIRTPCM